MAPKKRKRSTRPKATAKTTGVAKVPQAHGGALNAGGTPGNIGGTGRPPNEIREMLRRNLAEVLPIAHKRFGTDSSDADHQLKYLATIQQKAIPSEKEITVDAVRSRVAETVHVIRASLPAAQAEPLLAKLDAVWA